MRRFYISIMWFPVAFGIIALSFYLLFVYSENESIQSIEKRLNRSFPAITVFPTIHIKTDIKTDYRNKVLRKFLSDYDSPLIVSTDTLIKEADRNGIDYALIPAIAMQESNGCKVLPENSFNCWGFGIYGNMVTRFQSYDEAIVQIAKTIKEAYIKKGLTNPTLLEDRWAPPSRGVWSYSVNFFISKIREYEKNIPDS